MDSQKNHSRSANHNSIHKQAVDTQDMKNKSINSLAADGSTLHQPFSDEDTNGAIGKSAASTQTLRQRLWRWHFFAGLFVYPFIVLLATTGSIYLFKPQIEAWEEKQIHQQVQLTSSTPVNEISSGNISYSNVSSSNVSKNNVSNRITLSPDTLLNHVLSVYPNAKLVRYTAAKPNDRSVEFEIRNTTAQLANTQPVNIQHTSGQNQASQKLTVWVDQYSGNILETKVSNKRLLHVVKKLHSELLLGKAGSYLVELAACWSIVLIITGSYLWLTKAKTSAKEDSKRWRRRHGSWGLYLAIPVLIMLLTGLPWTQLWGGGFKSVKKTMGWDSPGQEWLVTLQSSTPNMTSDKMINTSLIGQNPIITLADIANKIDVKQLEAPVFIMPPKVNNGVWTVRSMPQKRHQRATIHYDQHTGDEIMRIDFNDHHPVDRAISHGVSLHEGALFGTFNQLLSLLTALSILLVSTLGIFIWWKRRPKGQLAAPKKTKIPMPYSLIGLAIALGIFLPAVGISLIAILILEGLFFRTVEI